VSRSVLILTFLPQQETPLVHRPFTLSALGDIAATCFSAIAEIQSDTRPGLAFAGNCYIDAGNLPVLAGG